MLPNLIFFYYRTITSVSAIALALQYSRTREQHRVLETRSYSLFDFGRHLVSVLEPPTRVPGVPGYPGTIRNELESSWFHEHLVLRMPGPVSTSRDCYF
eukprot:1895480-Rhodomonas_salina.1